MSNGTELTFKLDPETLEGMIKKQIEVSVASALAGNGEALIERLVTETLNQKVSESGVVHRDSYRNKYPFITVLTQNIIKEATKEAVQQWADENRDKVKAALCRELESDPRNVINRLAEGAVDGLARQANWDWRVHVHFGDD